MEQGLGQVFWLVDRPTCHAFPSRSYGTVAFRLAFVPTHSGGSATASHRLPYTQACIYNFTRFLYDETKQLSNFF